MGKMYFGFFCSLYIPNFKGFSRWMFPDPLNNVKGRLILELFFALIADLPGCREESRESVFF
jgi:hypothetical protein